jgi:hypothetical protein
MATLNEIYTRLSARRRYEVWFLRLGLADGAGAWWFRYLMMNPGRNGCAGNPDAQPFQVWATWFPRGDKPQSVIQGFPLANLKLSARGVSPFHLLLGENAVGETTCRGHLQVEGHEVVWTLQYQSNFRATLSNKGWIGFSRTPHADAVFWGEIRFDDRVFRGEPLGFGLQGHNCGYRHRNFWTWAHAFFPHTDGASTFEALTYEMPFGLRFRKAVLWHEGLAHVFRDWQESSRDGNQLFWKFTARSRRRTLLEVELDGSGVSAHRLPYTRTDCSGSFEVANNSLAKAKVTLVQPGKPSVTLSTQQGAVLEMAGD